jgi:superfamily II DNA/RNA helicase
VLVCTDVASRGLDFKGVAWIVQWDLSSNIKEYVNRVGRTARIAAEGSALSFVMPDELEYAKYLKKKYQIELHEKNRIAILKIFETKFQEVNSNLKYKFRKLVNIEANVDE